MDLMEDWDQQPNDSFVIRMDDDQPQLLILEGELDVAAAPAMDAALDRVRGSKSTIVLDVAGVNFVDSSGLNSLLRGANDSMTIHLRNAQLGFVQLVEMTHVGHILIVDPPGTA